MFVKTKEMSLKNVFLLCSILWFSAENIFQLFKNRSRRARVDQSDIKFVFCVKIFGGLEVYYNLKNKSIQVKLVLHFFRDRKGRIVKDAEYQSKIKSGEVARVEPNRKWFGNLCSFLFWFLTQQIYGVRINYW